MQTDTSSASVRTSVALPLLPPAVRAPLASEWLEVQTYLLAFFEGRRVGLQVGGGFSYGRSVGWHR